MPKKSAKTVLPDRLPAGEILTDIAKKKWCLGTSIGVGGFGEIYSAAECTDGSKKSSSYQYVVKIEPHGNGPLFCEMHFFMRNAKPEMIKTWCAENKVTHLGMPRYLGSGSHEYEGKKYRFLVMDKYGKDLWHIFLENKKQFPVVTVYRIALQILDVLQYIHNNGYIHADIKGSNILLGLSKSAQNQVFLVDFGLASHYTKKDFKPDPKKAHNGTIEYTSRDAHDGVATRRSDIEILAFNMVQWMGTVLPWEKNLTNPVDVYNSKKKYMSDISLFLNTCFGKKKAPGALKEFLEYVKKMNYDTEPDYKKLRTILTKGIKSEGESLTGALEFKKSEDDDHLETPEKRQRLTPAKNTRSKTTPKREATKLIEDSSDSETENEVPAKKQTKRQKKSPETKIDSPIKNGYNAEMLRLHKKIAERKAGKTKTKAKKSGSNSSGDSIPIFDVLDDDVIDGTPPETLKNRTRNRNAVSKMSNGGSDVDFAPRNLRQRR